MKTKIWGIMALAIAMMSCQNDFDSVYESTEGEVNFQISVDAVELATRAGKDGAIDDRAALNSAFGAIDYFQGVQPGDANHFGWDDVDLRYSLEVYDKADDYANATPIKKRMVKIVDSYEQVTFDLRLIPGREYRFVVFADFVPHGTFSSTTLDEGIDDQRELGLHHTIDGSLKNIIVKRDAINDERTDAYFATSDIEVNAANRNHTILLKRPYGKLRVITTDLAELNLNVHPKTIKVTYEATHPTTFNALTGVIGSEDDTKTITFDYSYVDKVRHNMDAHVYNADYDARTITDADNDVRHSHMTLFTDYILASDDERGVPFEIEVIDADGTPIKKTKFDTQIPIRRNYLTTVIGNVLTTATHIEVFVDDNFANVDDNDTTNDYNFTLLEVLMNGGEFTLTEDMTITEPTNLKGDAIIYLNGKTLNYVASKDDNKHAIMTRVENGSSLRFIGDGEVKSTGYIASANEGGKVYITGGKFTTTGCTLFQANGGEVYISGGEFQAEEYDGDYRYTLNHVDSKKNVGLIEVSGGKFYMYDPAKSASENPVMNFVKDGFGSFKDGDWYVVNAVNDYIDKGDHMEVYTAKGLAKWAYIVNNVDGKEGYGVKIMNDITLPQYALVADAVNNTYTFDETQPIDGTNSNWITVRNTINELADAFTGHVMGENHAISGLRINGAGDYAGFVGFIYDGASIKDLTFVDAEVNSTGANVGIAVGRAQDDTLVENVHIKSSRVSGSNSVGAVAGRNYSRVGGAQGQGYTEGPAVVRNCSTDAATSVNCTGDNAGGIVGYNYGATITDCENHADVTGESAIGGIVGYTRDYHHNKDGYIVACASYADASIKANNTNGNAGGIAGFTLADNNHTNTYMHIVGCLSLSNVDGKNKGAIIGNINHRQHTAGCVAVKNGTTMLYGKGQTSTEVGVTDAILYDAENGATQADVDALNAAIAHYTSMNPPQEAKCNYTWTLVNGFPVLQ